MRAVSSPLVFRFFPHGGRAFPRFVRRRGLPNLDVNLAAAPSINPRGANARAMAKKDEGPSLGWLYIGLGVAAAVGAGYLAWRYLLDEGQKQNIRSTAKVVASRSREMADEAVNVGGVVARDAVARLRNT